MKDVATAINEIKRKKENEKTLKLLINNLESYEGPPIADLGDLLLDGNIIMQEKGNSMTKLKTSKDQALHFFLFEDAIIYCKESAKTKNGPITYKFKGVVSVALLQINDQMTDTSEGNTGLSSLSSEFEKHCR